MEPIEIVTPVNNKFSDGFIIDMKFLFKLLAGYYIFLQHRFYEGP